MSELFHRHRLWVVSCLGGSIALLYVWSRRRTHSLPPSTIPVSIFEVELPSLDACVPQPPEGTEAADLLVIYGSESGTAHQYATSMAREAGFLAVNVAVQSGAEVALTQTPSTILAFLRSYKSVAFILATTGQGEAPKNFAPLQLLLEDAARSPKGEDGRGAGSIPTPIVAILGLGDSSYRRFCGCAVDVERLLTSLGLGLSHHPLALIDVRGDTPGDDVFQMWSDRLLEELAPTQGSNAATLDICPAAMGKFQFVPSESCAHHAYPTAASRSEPTARRPARCKVLFVRDLVTQPPIGSTLPPCGPVLHIGVDISSNETLRTYQAGDHLGVLAENPAPLVERALAVLVQRQRALLDRAPSAAPYGYHTRTSLDAWCPDTIPPLHALLGPNNVYDGLGVELCTEANLKARASMANTLPARVPLRQVLSSHLDLSAAPRRSLLRMLGRCCYDESERAQLLGGLLPTRTRTIVDVLEAFPSCLVPLDLFLEVTPKMAPRLYSIASDPITHPNHIEVLVKVVEGGLASSFLNQACSDDANLPTLYAFVRRSTFHMNSRSIRKTPVLLVGPGTGIAPLAGFLHRRLGYARKTQRSQAPLAPSYLFFGCRHTEVDFVLDPLLNPPADKPLLCPWSDLATALSTNLDNVLTLPVYVALSRQAADSHHLAPPMWFTGTTQSQTTAGRDTSRRTYVQDLLWERREEVCRVILGCACVGVDDDSQHPVSRGCVYICGDATHMAKDVDKVLCRILVECAGLSEDRANDHLRMMEKSERYMLDVW